MDTKKASCEIAKTLRTRFLEHCLLKNEQEKEDQFKETVEYYLPALNTRVIITEYATSPTDDNQWEYE